MFTPLVLQDLPHCHGSHSKSFRVVVREKESMTEAWPSIPTPVPPEPRLPFLPLSINPHPGGSAPNLRHLGHTLPFILVIFSNSSGPGTGQVSGAVSSYHPWSAESSESVNMSCEVRTRPELILALPVECLHHPFQQKCTIICPLKRPGQLSEHTSLC